MAQDHWRTIIGVYIDWKKYMLAIPEYAPA